MTQDTIIRIAEKVDLSILSDIIPKTFIQAFGDQNSDANMDMYLEEYMTPKAIAKEFYESGSTFYLLKYKGIDAGYLKLNEDSNPPKRQLTDSIAIQRIYIITEYQNMGLGQMLLDYCDQVAQEKRKQSMWLGVWEKNLAAIRFYERNGFYKIDEHIFRLGDEDQTDHLMLKEFRQ